jgi:hypothetical protein
MRVLQKAVFAFVVLAVLPIIPTAVGAQGAVTAADLAKLDTTATEIDGLAGRLKATDPTLSAQVTKSLVDLRDEITYLKVKLKREGTVTRDEYNGLRDRLETLRLKATGPKAVATPPAEGVRRTWTVPVGTELDVRLQSPLNSGTAKVEERFEATTVVDFEMTKTVVIPAGAIVRGFVSSVRAAGKIDRRGSLTLSFDELRISERSYKLRASVVQALDGKLSQDTTRIGAGAVVGGIIGGIIGGGKGALLGVLVGGGGTMAATEGADVTLPAGTILRIRLDQPIDVETVSGDK